MRIHEGYACFSSTSFASPGATSILLTEHQKSCSEFTRRFLVDHLIVRKVENNPCLHCHVVRNMRSREIAFFVSTGQEVLTFNQKLTNCVSLNFSWVPSLHCKFIRSSSSPVPIRRSLGLDCGRSQSFQLKGAKENLGENLENFKKTSTAAAGALPSKTLFVTFSGFLIFKIHFIYIGFKLLTNPFNKSPCSKQEV